MLFGEQVHLRPFVLHPLSAGSCSRSGAQCRAGWREAVREVPVFWRDLEESRVRSWSPLQWRQHPWAPSIVPVGIRRCGAAGQNVSGNRPQTGRPTPENISSRACASESEKKTPERQSKVEGTVAPKDEGTLWSVKLDMSNFRPEDIKVVSLEGGFRVDATRETPWRGGGVFRMQISRIVETPAHVNKKNVRVWLGADGILNFAEKARNSSTLETNAADPTQILNGNTSETDLKGADCTAEKPKKETTSQACESDSNQKDSTTLTPSDSTLQNDDPMDADATCGQESDTDATRGVQDVERSAPVSVPVEKTTDDRPTTTVDGHDVGIEMDNANDITDKTEGTNDDHNTIEKADDAHDITHKMNTVNETLFKMEDLTDVAGTQDDVHDVSEEMENKFDIITMDDVNDVTSNTDAGTDVSDELPEFVNHVIDGDNDVMSNEDLILTQTKDAPFRKCMDVSGFDPSDLVIKVVDRTVSVEAERQEDVDGVETLRRISCSFKLPPGVDADSIRSAVTSDGSLTIFGHLESEANTREKIVSIQRIA